MTHRLSQLSQGSRKDSVFGAPHSPVDSRSTYAGERSIRRSAIKVVSSLENDSSVSPTRLRAIQILTAPSCDYVVGFVIFVNMIVMIAATDQSANQDGSVRDESTWISVFGWIALTIFILELLLRLYAFRSLFWKDGWNVFDFLVVVLDAGFSVASLLVGHAFPMSILRMFRLAKLFRVARVLRIFPELRLLLGGMVGSLRAIFWGLLLLVLFLIVWGIAAVLLINPLAQEMDPEACERCPFAYDSVFHAALTFWQQIVAGDAWAEATVPIIRKHPLTIFFFLPLFMTIGMAVMNLILGVVVDIELSTKAQHEEEDKQAYKAFKLEQRYHLNDICKRMDISETGCLSRKAVLKNFDEPGEFQKTLRSMDITEEDLKAIWTAIDRDKAGSLPCQELVNGLYSMRESDPGLMLASFKHQIALIRSTLHNLDSKMQQIKKEVKDIQEHAASNQSCEKDLDDETQRWQLLDEHKQTADNVGGNSDLEMNGSKGQDTSKPKSRTSWFILPDTATPAPLKDGTGDAGNRFSHDINVLKAELQDLLVNMSHKLSQTFNLVSQKSVANIQPGSKTAELLAQPGHWLSQRESTEITPFDREATITSSDGERTMSSSERLITGLSSNEDETRAARDRARLALMARHKVIESHGEPVGKRMLGSEQGSHSWV